MEHSSETRKLAFNWLIGAGIVAAGFCTFLFWADQYLSNSKKEAENAQAISEIRRAQAALPSGKVDDRLLYGVSVHSAPSNVAPEAISPEIESHSEHE